MHAREVLLVAQLTKGSTDYVKGCAECQRCQGPSHGGSYMDEGMFRIRIELLPIIVPGDYLASLSYTMPHCLLLHV